MADWITVKEAAAVLGVHRSAIPKMIRRGDLTKRHQRPILDRAQVLAYRDARQAACDARLTDVAPQSPAPPDDWHEWLTPDDVGVLLGISRIAVMARARRERLPSVVANRRRWFRKDHLDLILHAQDARARRRP